MIKNVLPILLICFLCLPVYAQFQVTSSSINDGDIDVATTTTLSLTFSERLDLSRSLSDLQDGRFLRFAAAPRILLQVGEIVVSADRMTVDIPLTLEQDQDYVFVLIEAYSEAGALVQPYVVHFSTGDMLPNGIVSGNISLQDGSAENAFVVLLPAEDINGEVLEDPFGSFVHVGLVTSQDGSYDLRFVSAGEYYALAIKDMDENGRYRLLEGDAFGYYNQLLLPEKVTVSEGEAVAGIDIQMIVLDLEMSTTDASAALARVAAQIFLLSFTGDIQLLSVVALDTVNTAGEARVWNYTYYAPNKDQGVIIGYSGDNFLYVFPAQVDMNNLNPLPENWIGSAEALQYAGEAGGGSFLEEYSNAYILAGAFGGRTESYYFETPVWLVQYVSTQPAARLPVFIDAETGAVVDVAGTTAAGAVDATTDAASNWANDAQLISVETMGRHNDPGTFSTWIVNYRSDSQNLMNTMAVTGTGTILSNKVWVDTLTIPRPTVKPGWQDSPDILVASNDFADFMATHTDVWVVMRLAAQVHILPADTTLYWNIVYTGLDAAGQPAAGWDRLNALTAEPGGVPVFTAFDGYELATEEAAQWAPDAALFSIRSSRLISVDTAGEAAVWVYTYFSPSFARFFRVYIAGNNMDSIEGSVEFTTEIPVLALPSIDELITSEEAIRTADDDGGGNAFRAAYPLGRVSASLNQIRVKQDSSLTLWIIIYTVSPLQKQLVIIDAGTDDLIAAPPRTTDWSAFQTAYADAKEWASDAVLRYAEADSVDLEGLVETWRFAFYSVSLDQLLMLEVAGGSVVFNEYITQSLSEQYAMEGDIINWMESSEAVRLANEVIGDELSAASVLSNISAVLTYMTPPGEALTAGSAKYSAAQEVWIITYHTNTGVSHSVYVGDGLATTDAHQHMPIPRDYTLGQNYPNPFRSSTTIQYALPVQCRVRLEVFDVLGRKVATLVDQVQQAQPYAIRWDASDTAAGIYLYRLEAVSTRDLSVQYIDLKTMTLIR